MLPPLDLIHQFLDKTRPPATRAAEVATIKALLIRLPVGHWMGKQLYHALRLVFEDPTEAAEVRQAATQAIYELPSSWFVSFLELERDPLYQKDQLQHTLARLRQAMTVSGLRRVFVYASVRDPHDPHVLAILAEAARHPDPAIRAEVPWRFLASYGDLGTALHDAAPGVRAAAAEALGYQDIEQLGVEGLRALEGALADPDQAVRGAAQVALRRLGVRPLPPPPLAPPVVQAPPAGTTRFAWTPFLAQWSWHLLQGEEVRADYPDAVIASGWVGSPGATEAQLAEAEQRLGRRLPPSHRAFLRITNGWLCGLRCDFKNYFQLDRHPQRQTGHAQHDPGREFLFPEHVDQHVRSRIGNARMLPEIALRGDQHA